MLLFSSFPSYVNLHKCYDSIDMIQYNGNFIISVLFFSRKFLFIKLRLLPIPQYSRIYLYFHIIFIVNIVVKMHFKLMI